MPFSSSRPGSPGRPPIERGRRVKRAVAVAAAALAALTPSVAAATSALAAADSLGSDFWVSFPTNYQGASTLELFVTGAAATSGTVSIPGLSYSQGFSVTPGVATKLTLPSNAELSTDDGVEHKGIHVTASGEVSVYGLNRISATTDAFLGLPTDVLGTEYLVLSYAGLNGAGSYTGGEFSVTATQDDTAVTITPSVAVGTHAAGTPYTVNLSAGDAYQLHSPTGADLTGSIVTSNHPVSVFGGSKCSNVPVNYGACDHLVEEMTPPSTWGKSFVTEPLATRTRGDNFRVLASADNTHVSINGTLVATLNRGKFFEKTLTAASTVTADQPVLLAQYSNGTTFDGVTSDPFVMLIPPYEQFMSSYTVATADSQFGFTNYVNVVAPTSAVGAIQGDGTAIPASAFHAIPGSTFSGAQLAVSPGSHTYRGPAPFGVYVYGFAYADSYGYPGGLSLAPVATVSSVAVTPATDSGLTGAQLCKTATVSDQYGNPVPNVRVDFAVSGANTTTGSVTAGTDGTAQFCYTGSAAGNDTVRASVGTVSGTAGATWTPSDTTPPTLTGTPTTDPNSDGWYAGDVVVHWTATDAGAGVDPATMPADSVITGEGKGLTASASVSDLAGNSATAVSAPSVDIDRTPPVTTATAPSGWTTGATVSLTADDNLSGVKATYASLDGAPAVATDSVTIDTDGTHTLTFHSVDKAGNVEADRSVTVDVDATAPSITHDQSPAANAHGWNDSPVHVTFSCADGGGSGLASCTPAAADVTGDGFGQEVTGTATDNAGNSASDIATVNLDQQPPTVSATVPAPNARGWYNAPVPVSFACADGLSGVASCPSATIDRDGRNLSATGTASDLAGNTADASVSGIDLDTVPPTIAASADHAANAAGWYKEPVTISFACADALSGVSSCTAPVTLSTDGAGQSASGLATDEAGNSASATFDHVDVDTTPPVVTAAVSGPQVNGYYTGAATVTFTCADATSGIKTCPAPVTLDHDGLDQSVTGTAVDVAGNTTTVTVAHLSVDTTGPQIAGAPTTDADAAGWYAHDVTVHFDCSDATSGIASCPPDQTVTGDDADHHVTGTATDNAGHSATTTVGPIRIDTTAPGLTGVPTTAPASGHWYRGDVTIHWTPSDTGSGIDPATVPGDSVITGEGEGLYASASVSDLAGNSATAASGPVDIDRTPPVTTATVPDHWVNTDVAVDLTAKDALSGVAGTSYSLDGGDPVSGIHVDITTEGQHTLRYWSTDVAGNVESHHTALVTIDKSAPTITDTHVPAPNGNGWNETDVTVTFSCDDTGGSGVASCSDPQTVTGEVTAQAVTGTATDNAGNSTSDTTSVSIDRTKPTITADVPGANAHGWYDAPVTVTFGCADERSGVATCTPPVTFGLDGAGQSADGHAEDRAGNAAATTVSGIDVDTTAPTIAASTPAVPNAAGWYREPVTVHFSCADGLSGVASCPADLTLAGDGANQHAAGTAVDNADNTASAELDGLNVDATAPEISAHVTSRPNAAGWYAGPVTVHFTCSDTTSGVASCPADVTLTGDGAGQSVSGTAYDVAGNSARVSVGGIDIDATAPTITATATPAANANGWRKTDVTVSFSCADTTSGVASCPAPVTVAEGAGQSVNGVAADRAGNTAKVTVSPINVDKTAPVVTYSGDKGVYTVDETVSIGCTATDALSGVASTTCADVTGPAYSFAIGANQASATATDKAGNVGSATASFTVGVTYDALCALTQRFSKDADVAHSLCVKLGAAQASALRGNLTAKRGQLGAYANELTAETGTAFTAGNAAVLQKLVSLL